MNAELIISLPQQQNPLQRRLYQGLTALAWLVTGRWLQQYAYRITQDAGNYLLAGAIVCVASFLLIGLQCMKVALANPVKSLKTE